MQNCLNLRGGILFALALVTFCASDAKAEKQPGIPNPPINVNATPAVPGSAVMNGIKLQDYMGFEEKWKLVTVRFRKDIDEMRFEYANPAAWDVISAGRTDYPDGAVFAKIGVQTEEDPNFINSIVPSGGKRYQIMVRDKVKFASTGGWGYAVFLAKDIPTGHTAEEEKKMTDACFACHQVVTKDNYIFARPANIKTVFSQPTQPPTTNKHNDYPPGIAFIDQSPRDVPPAIRMYLPPTERIRFLEGSARDHASYGMLNELRPTLTKEAGRSGLPAVFASNDFSHFVVIIPSNSHTLPDNTDCPGKETVFSVFSSLRFNDDKRYYCD